MTRWAEPIAIVGIGCRFPGGANSPRSFWRLLSEGVDAVTEVPAERWNVERYYDPTPGRPGKTYSRWGAFVDGIKGFDAGFFGISPREAARIDPQHRILLETAWEALEDAGECLASEDARRTGVFVGIAHIDYSLLQSTADDQTTIDVYTPTGTAHSIAPNRISHFLDLTGPSVAFDTACSSSLTALHYACQSLAQGECRAALAGGTNVLLTPTPFIGFSLASMLSADGRCHTFDARANGFVRGEGAGMVLLKPLSLAEADGDPIYALILGTAANQDGGSGGLTVPNAKAQQHLVTAACRQAGVEPCEIAFVEAHGTGTPVGDPIEVRALDAALSPGRAAEEPCLIGSVKTNIGHLESAAGIAGLIKATLAVHHRQVPPHINLETPNPALELDRRRLRIATELEKMPRYGERVLAGVNSFGFGGANAHAILAEPPSVSGVAERPAAPPNRPHLLALSARSRPALLATAKLWRDFAADGEGAPSAVDLCYTAGARRRHHRHRLAVVGSSGAELGLHLEEALAKITGDQATPARRDEAAGLVLVCGGQGPQWPGMGSELYADEEVFRRSIEECEEALGAWADWSLIEELNRGGDDSRLAETAIAQPAIFAIQVSLARLLESWGVVPDAILGHSVGEVAAAHLAGALDLQSAAGVIYHRGLAMQNTDAAGGMLAVDLSRDEAEGLAADCLDVHLAAVNSPSATTLGGSRKELEAIEESLRGQGRFCRMVPVSYPFHTPAMEPAAVELEDRLADLKPRPPRIELFSTVTGKLLEDEALDAGYWADSVRRPVRFAEAIDAAAAAGHDLFLEIAPHPALAVSIRQCLASAPVAATVVSTLRREEPERETLLRAVGELYEAGADIVWTELAKGGRPLRAPTYPWQRERHWHEAAGVQDHHQPHPHPVLKRMDTTEPRWQGTLDPRLLPHLEDHRVHGRMIFPAAGHLELALAAARELFGERPCVLEDVQFESALWIPDAGPAPRVQLSYSPANGEFEIHSQAEHGADWTRRSFGRLRELTGGRGPATRPLAELRSRCDLEEPTDLHYSGLRRHGLEHGPAYQTVLKLWSTRGASLGRVGATQAWNEEANGYRIPPPLLDGAFQVVRAGLERPEEGEPSSLRLPRRLRRLVWHAPPGDAFLAVSELTRDEPFAVEAELSAIDQEGRTALEIEGFLSQTIESVTPQESGADGELLYELRWRLQPLPGELQSRTPAEYLPPVARLETAARERAAELAGAGDRDRLRSCDEQLQRLAGGYLWEALAAMGWLPGAGDELTTDELAARLEVGPDRTDALERCLRLLAACGRLRRSADRWQVAEPIEVAEPAALWRKILSRHPAARPELALLHRWGRSLPEILRGELAADAWLTLSDDDASAHLFGEGWRFRRHNRLLGKMLATALENLPEGRGVAVLELGCNTLSFAHARVPATQVEYVCGLPTDSLCREAEERFRGLPAARFLTVDLDRPPGEQDLDLHRFDVVLGVRALRAAADPCQALAHLRRLLAPEGLLLLLEQVRPVPWMDALFGPAAPGGLSLDRDGWRDLLMGEGFSEVSSVTGGEPAEHALLLARAPSAPAPQPEPAEAESSGAWVLLADRGGVAERLAERLRRHGERCLVAHPAEHSRPIDDRTFEIRLGAQDGYRQLVEELGADRARWVHLGSLDSGAPGTGTSATHCAEAADDGALDEAQRRGCLSTVDLVRSLLEGVAGTAPMLWLVTAGAQPAGREPGDLAVAQAPLVGLGRVIANELPQLDCRRVDLGRQPDERELEALARELIAGDGEPEVALRGEGRFVQRLTRGVTPVALEGNDDLPYRLELTRPGSFDNLRLRAETPRGPAPGEVEITVSVAALNFRDVMKVLGIYPASGADALELGDECAGRVTAVGPGVEGLSPGDEVMALGTGCLASRLRLPADQVLALPAGRTAEEAATLPIAFLTAWYALHHLAGLGSGERVLIHSATGGVGMAALQVAERAGAEIYATAGSETKRELLRALGIEHVFDSRALEFAEQIHRVTGGGGVDVVLNSLSGQAIDKGLEVLRPFGRFLELGKRDIHENRKLAMRLMQDNLALFAVDLGQARQQRPDLVHSLLAELQPLFASGELRPLPARVFPAADAQSALRTMARARHVGKLLVSFDRDPPGTLAPPLRDGSIEIRAEASYLITGGLGGFGLEVARWLVKHGARSLILAGRRGAATPAVEARVEELRQQGAEILVARCDVSRAGDVDALLQTIDDTLPPLAGVVHAAMVIDDATVPNLTPERFSRVTAPKVLGAWNLHRGTRSRPLDFFVLFSSAAGVVGNPGQGSYAAANVFLDALAHYRHGLGLPALSVDWGVLGDVGVVARHHELQELLSHQGLTPLSPRQATSSLGRLLALGATQASVMAIDWRRFAEAMPIAAGSPRLEALIDSQPLERVAAGGGARIRDSLGQAPSEQRLEILEAYLCDKVGRALGLDAASLSRREPLIHLVTDSLVGVELATSIQSELRVGVPLAQLLAGGDIEGLAKELLRTMEAGLTPERAAAGTGTIQT